MRTLSCVRILMALATASLTFAVHVHLPHLPENLFELVSSYFGHDYRSYPLWTCYPGVGCFWNRWPWATAVRRVPPPAAPEEVIGEGLFCTRLFPNCLRFPVYPTPDLSYLPFDRQKMTYVLFHGWTGSADEPIMRNLRLAVLEVADVNVIVADYKKGAAAKYFQACSNIRVVSRIWSRVLLQMKIPNSQLRMMGFSLGAHTAAYVARVLNAQTADTDKVDQIIGLDPAGFMFQQFPGLILQKEDANFVMALHAAGQASIGMTKSVGHVDFYLNGNGLQPDCQIEGLQNPLFCSHSFGAELFTKAISHDGCYTGQRRDATTSLLGFVNDATNGSYFEWIGRPNCDQRECLPLRLDVQPFHMEGDFAVLTHPSLNYCKWFFPKTKSTWLTPLFQWFNYKGLSY